VTHGSILEVSPKLLGGIKRKATESNNTGRRKQSTTRTSVRKEKALSSDDIEKALKTYCCKAECMKKVISKEDMLKCRKDFRSLSEEDQRAFLLRFFTFRVYHHKGKRCYTFRLPNGKDVCRKAWLKTYSISPTS